MMAQLGSDGGRGQAREVGGSWLRRFRIFNSRRSRVDLPDRLICPLGDPADKKIDLFPGKHFALRRHMALGHHVEKEAFSRFSRDQGRAAFPACEHEFYGAEIEARFPGFLPVTREAVIGHQSLEIFFEGENGTVHWSFQGASAEKKRSQQGSDQEAGKAHRIPGWVGIDGL